MSTVSTSHAAYDARRIARGEHQLYLRDYPGDGPTFVLLHGFPDNLRIYDRLAPLLQEAGARVIAFDFLGYGASDKPAGFRYDARGWEDDLGAVLDALDLTAPIVVAHDASGPTALNFALDHPGRLGGVVLMNVYYGEAPSLVFPQFIALYADPRFRPLGLAMLQDPNIFGWLMTFQGAQFAREVPEELGILREWLTPHIRDQFVSQPSVAPAFLSVTGDLQASVARNTAREGELAKLATPVSLVWGAADPYLNLEVAERLQRAIPDADLVSLPLSHWPQITGPEAVRDALLSSRAAAA